MIRGLVLLILGAAVLVVGLVAFTPLGFVLERSGLANVGAGWAQAEGSLLKGRIGGLHVRGQAVGDVVATLRPLSLLKGQAVYDVQWAGAGGRGTGGGDRADGH